MEKGDSRLSPSSCGLLSTFYSLSRTPHPSFALPRCTIAKRNGDLAPGVVFPSALIYDRTVRNLARPSTKNTAANTSSMPQEAAMMPRFGRSFVSISL